MTETEVGDRFDRAGAGNHADLSAAAGFEYDRGSAGRGTEPGERHHAEPGVVRAGGTIELERRGMIRSNGDEKFEPTVAVDVGYGGEGNVLVKDCEKAQIDQPPIGHRSEHPVPFPVIQKQDFLGPVVVEIGREHGPGRGRECERGGRTVAEGVVRQTNPKTVWPVGVGGDESESAIGGDGRGRQTSLVWVGQAIPPGRIRVRAVGPLNE